MACTEHVQYQLPNEHSCVGFLLNSVQCADARLQAAMASAKTDNGPDGMHNHFEQAAAHLLPYDPVAKKWATGIKCGSALILKTEAESETTATVTANETKPSIGKTGVHLRYHKHHEYKKLMQEQRHELSEWRQNNPDTHKLSFTKKSCGTDKTTQSKQISTLVLKQVAAEMQKFNQSINMDTTTTAPSSKSAKNDEQYLMSVVQAAVAKHFATTPTAAPNPTPFNLKSIIRQAHNNSP